MRYAPSIASAILIAASSALIGCNASPQFAGMVRYGNLLSSEAASDAETRTKEQITKLADQYGLQARHVGDDRMHFVAQAPDYMVVMPDGSESQRADPRVVHVEVHFDNQLGARAYRYTCRVEGDEPADFDEQSRGFFALALLGVREIFETPLTTDYLSGDDGTDPMSQGT